MLTNIPLRPGINDRIVESFKQTVLRLKTSNDKLCAVVFDELSLASLLSYNRQHDCFNGLEDDGTLRMPHRNPCKCVSNKRNK